MTTKDLRTDPYHSGGSSSTSAAAGKDKHARERTNSVPEVVFFQQLRLTEENRQLRQPYAAPVSLDLKPGGQGGIRRKGKSWKDILKLKRKRAKMQSLKQTSERGSHESDVYRPRIGGYCIRVVVTEISPQAYYKTLEVTDRTTAFEVIVKLIQKYAAKEVDKDPNEFYLMEVKDGKQGSYSRVLANTDQLYQLQRKWAEEEDCYFALYRAQLPPASATADVEVEDKSQQQADLNSFRAMIISPSQDSFFDSFPDPRDNHFPSHSSTTRALPVSTHSLTTPTSHTNLSYRDLSSRVQVSKLIVSPSESSIDTNLEQENDHSSPLPTFPLTPIKTTPKYSNLNIETIAENEEEEEELVISCETKERSSSERRLTQRQQMQRSLSMGMQGIMAKVISETKQNSPIGKKAHERSQTSPSRFLNVSPSLPRDSPQHDLTIRNLVYSPLAPTMVNRTKNIPDFVFTPGPDEGGTSDSEVDFLGSESSGPMRSAGSADKSFGLIGVLDFDGYTGGEEDMERKDGFKENERCGKINEDEELESHRELGKRAKEKNSFVGKESKGIDDSVLAVAEEDTHFKLSSEESFAQAPQEGFVHLGAAEVVDKSKETANSFQSKERKQDQNTTEVACKDGNGDSPGANCGASKVKHWSNTSNTPEERLTASSNSYGLFTHPPKVVEILPLENSSLAQSSLTTIHKTLSPSHPAAPVSTVTAKKSVEAKISLPLKRSLTSEFKQTVQHSDHASSTLEYTRSVPDIISKNRVQGVHDDSSINKTSSGDPSGAATAAVASSKHAPLRRSHTLHENFSSVMRENRPHSIHYSKPLPNVAAVDFTKDDVIRRAALRGMVKKPKPPENLTSKMAKWNEGKEAEFPRKDITTDLDAVTRREKKHHVLPPRRYSLFDVKSTTADHSYIRIKDRKAVLDGSPPRRPHLHQGQERPAQGARLGESEEGSPRPNSAPAKISKKVYTE